MVALLLRHVSTEYRNCIRNSFSYVYHVAGVNAGSRHTARLGFSAGHVILEEITGTIIVEPGVNVELMQFIWRSDTRRWNLWVPDHQMRLMQRPAGSAFIKPDQGNPWIKDQIGNALLSTISYLQLPNFVSYGRDKPSHTTQNLVTVGAKL